MSTEQDLKHQVMLMQTIGILGGMSNQATAEYYRLINTGISQMRGGWNTAQLLLYSILKIKSSVFG